MQRIRLHATTGANATGDLGEVGLVRVQVYQEESGEFTGPETLEAGIEGLVVRQIQGFDSKSGG